MLCASFVTESYCERSALSDSASSPLDKLSLEVIERYKEDSIKMSMLEARFLFFSSRSALNTAEFAESIRSFSKTLRTGTVSCDRKE